MEATLEGVIQSNYPLYRTPANTTAAPHTLLIEVAERENVTLIVDYITYMPAESAATTTVSSSTSSRKSHAGAIAGGIVGGLVFLLIATFVLHFFRHRRRQLRFRSTFSEYFLLVNTKILVLIMSDSCSAPLPRRCSLRNRYPAGLDCECKRWIYEDVMRVTVPGFGSRFRLISSPKVYAYNPGLMIKLCSSYYLCIGSMYDSCISQ